MQILTLLNEKGGVGKTSLATHIASGLAIRGARVLLVDTDAQANATTALGLPESGGLNELLFRDAEWRDVLLKPAEATYAGDHPVDGELMVLTSDIQTRVLPMVIDGVTLFGERLDELHDQVDVCVIDTSPTPSLLHSSIYLVSDYMIYPTQAELGSMVGVGKSAIHTKRMTDTRKQFGLEATKLIGVCPTMFRGNTVAHRHGLAMIREQFGALTMAPIAERIAWAEASYMHQMLYAYAPDSDATMDAWRLTDLVADRMEVA